MVTVPRSGSISYKQLGVILISFIIGMAAAGLVLNAKSNVQNNFSTPELISYVLSLVLSAASIVLSMVAISLGKFSEDAILKRSDESMKLQTEVFLKTTEALQDIKASTGVTEKRIEDIIAGRAGELSQTIAEYAKDRGGVGKIDVEELRKEIEESISREFRARRGIDDQLKDVDQKESRKERENRIIQTRKRYEEAHDSLLLSVGNIDGVKIEKIGHGIPHIGREPRDRLDSIFEKDGKKFSITTIAPNVRGKLSPIINDYDAIAALVDAVEKVGIERLYIVLFIEDDVDVDFDDAIVEKFKSIFKPDLVDKITFKVTKYSELGELLELLENQNK